ncbi:MAG: hypothetical protein CMI55_02210 [Parcubacteria group bacterium]|nr:hypothetical protein [Parcubacteria group bacterium]|tara:strand:+ start:353 stop:1666 length:1314 start_codon:yes stop_codon:yes gene_type:complete
MGQSLNFLKNHLFIGRKAKSKTCCLLALDIGTEFVKAVIFKVGKTSSDDGESKEQAVIIGVGRQRQMANQMRAGAVADIEGVALTCQKVINQAAQMARSKPTRVVIGIAGEFIKGATTNFVYKRSNSEQRIGLAELKNIIQKIQWKAFNKIRSQIAWETGRPEVEIRLINALIPEIRIDGYQVANPLGFPGQEVFLSIFNVYAPLIHLSALENIVAKLDLELLSIVAEPYALTKSSSLNPMAGAILIDIGGGTTDIALVRQGKIEGIKSFSLAGQAFTKRLCQSLDLDLPEAEDIKIRHSHRQLSQNVQRKIREILKNDVRIWLNGVELILEEFDQKEFFPSTILLCGGGSILPDIKNILSRETVQREWMEKLPFSRAPEVKFIRSSQIDNVIDQANVLKGPENIVPLALSGLALEILTDEVRILPSVLRRVARIMR